MLTDLQYVTSRRRAYTRPILLDTDEKVRAANKLDKQLGIKPHWRLGDHCYYSIVANSRSCA